jgi:hypothetical protein
MPNVNDKKDFFLRGNKILHYWHWYCHAIVTRHVVWVDNWNYWTLITCNYSVTIRVSRIYTLYKSLHCSTSTVFDTLISHFLLTDPNNRDSSTSVLTYSHK